MIAESRIDIVFRMMNLMPHIFGQDDLALGYRTVSIELLVGDFYFPRFECR